MRQQATDAAMDPTTALATAIRQNTRALVALNATLWAHGAALTANTQEEGTLVATLDDLTNIATTLASDDSALKTSLDAVVAALAAAKAGGFTPDQQAALDSAVSQLQTVHADLQSDAQEATSATTPPTPPAGP